MLVDLVAFPTLGAAALKESPKEAKEHAESTESQPKDETKKEGKGEKPKKSMCTFSLRSSTLLTTS